MPYVMVLNDGETYSDLEGCFIAEVPENFPQDQLDEKSMRTNTFPIHHIFSGNEPDTIPELARELDDPYVL